MADREINLKVKVNTQTGELEILGHKIEGVSNQAKKAEGSFKGLSGGAKELLGSLGLLATSTGIVTFFAASIKGAEQEARAMRLLDSAVESVNGNVAAARPLNEAWLRSVDRLTKFSDGEMIPVLDKFVRVTGNVEQAQLAAELAMGHSTKTGKELGQSIQFVNDLLNGNERALIEARREFGNLVGDATTTQDVLDRLSGTLSKAAFEEEGLTSSSAKLKNSFGNLKDTVGDSLTGPLSKLFDWLAGMIERFDQFGLVVASIAAKTAVTFQAMGEAAERVAHLDFAGAKQSFQDLATQIESIDKETEANFITLEQKRTSTVVAHNDTRLRVTKAAHDREVAEEKKKQAALDKLRAEELKKEQLKAKLKAELERAQRLDTLDAAAQTLQILNGFTDQDTKAAANRAKAILAFEKAIAIARIWSAEALNPGLAAAHTALVVAQFAQQFGAIDSARSAFDQGSRELSVSTDLGNGRELRETFGGDDTGSFVGGGSSGSGGGGGGGGGSVVIHVGGVHVSLAFDNLSIDNLPFLMRKMSDAMRQGVTEGVQLAVQSVNTGNKNASRAV